MAEYKDTRGLPVADEKTRSDGKEFLCSVCIEYFVNPRSLPGCGHTFCENCIVAHAEYRQSQKRNFECPMCGKPHGCLTNDADITLQDWVQTLPLVTTSLTRTTEKPSDSTEKVIEEKRTCDPCKDEGVTNVGFKVCIDCNEVLCEECTKCHRKFKVSKDHRLSEIKKMQSAYDVCQGAGKCSEHPKLEVDFYCISHDVYICYLCASMGCKSCVKTEIRKNNMDVVKLRKESERLKTHMRAAITQLNIIQQRRQDVKNNLKQKLKLFMQNTMQLRDQVVELMDNTVRYISDVAKQIKLEKGDELDTEINKMSKLHEVAQQNVSLLNAVEEGGSETEIFVSNQLLRKSYEDMSKQISDESKQVKDIEIELVISDSIKKLTENADFDSIAKLIVKCDEIEIPLKRDTIEPFNDLEDCKLVTVEEHIVVPDHKSTPLYTGVSACKDGRIALSDYSYGQLCLFNPSNKSMKNKRLKSAPFCAAQVDASHLAVSTPDTKTITIVDIDRGLMLGRTLQSLSMPMTLVPLKNGQMAVSWNSPPSISIIDVSGRDAVLKLYLEQDSAKRKFKSFEYLAVDETRQHVLQPCVKDNVVYCFDFSGRPIFKYTDLIKPQGIALDRCGNIYVCECTSPGSIYKLSPSGDLVNIFTKAVPSSPLAICRDVEGTGFWVTRRTPPCNTVVYMKLV